MGVQDLKKKKLDSDCYKQLSHIACPGPLVSLLS